MKNNLSKTLRDILADTALETEWYHSRQSLKRLKQMLKDASPVLSFRDALSSGPALIAEIKEQSPSQGRMLPRNLLDAPVAYKASPVVKVISVLTNRTHFGNSMRIERLRKIKELTSKPVLRKDFITDAYQVYQARAFGADAILLMANILEAEEMKRLSDLAFELGMDVLFETHCEEELEDLPPAAILIGINCRNFNTRPSGFKMARLLRQWWLWSQTDKTVNLDRFNYASQLPAHAIKVAESGVTSQNCSDVFALGFHAALVGTSLLMDPRGIAVALDEFKLAMLARPAKRPAPKELVPSMA